MTRSGDGGSPGVRCVINFTLRRSKWISAPKKYLAVSVIDQPRVRDPRGHGGCVRVGLLIVR